MELAVQPDHVKDPQTESGKLGLWFFILSEIMLFGAFFSSYLLARLNNAACALGTPAWPKPGYTGGLALAAFNTVVLITSSYTMIRALLFARENNPRAARTNLLITVSLGALFLVVKAFEYSMKIHHGYFPGGEAVVANPGLGIFVSYYFAMTGLHALHIVAGIIWIAAVCRSARPDAGPAFPRKVEYAGLYWHFVDVVWVFLFPLFYLI